ncbi:Phyllosphere-induced regulator PhyR [Alphaproteobacteria bacterium SO-S41]|nr:Phyllosphere-induced regulator PhyR [Alphaproteobacteria bacterium SO-S41]
MSVAANFGPFLPYLRRYARALTGSQKSGDSFVRAALEAVLAAPDQISAEHPPRVELYRIFHAVWSPTAAHVDVSQTGGDGEGGVLQLLTAGAREALLLTAVEGFSLEETATILGRPEADVQREIDAARKSIMEELRCAVMIIEDESIIAMHLQSIVEDLGHRVTGIATTRTEAAGLARRTAPDLVLADIRLADGSSGIDAVKDLLVDFDVPVIFITAYPERLLTGERPEPTYLVTKPFLPETVTATIGQALLFHRERATKTAA